MSKKTPRRWHRARARRYHKGPAAVVAFRAMMRSGGVMREQVEPLLVVLRETAERVQQHIAELKR